MTVHLSGKKIGWILALGHLVSACGVMVASTTSQQAGLGLPANTVSFPVSEDEFRELPANFVFAHQIDDVNDQIDRITKAFKTHLGVHVSVTPTLIEVYNEPVYGNYSYHKIDFGTLTPDEFKRLNEYYQFPLGPTLQRDFKPEKRYSIEDFLVPKIQSLSGKTTYGRFKPISVSQKPYPGEGAAYIPNCVTTVHDILTSDRAPFDLHGFNYDMANSGAFHIGLFTGSSHFRTLKLGSVGEIKAYDVFTLISDESLDHAAVFVAPGVVFEKEAPGSERYKIRALDDIHFEIESSGFHRLVQPLPLPVEFPNLSPVELWKVQHPIKVSLDKATGRFIPDPGTILSKAVGQYSTLSTCPRAAAEKELCDNYLIRQKFIFDELGKD
jgi:hypothetical protein